MCGDSEMHNAENDKTAYVQSVEAAVTTAVQSAEAKNSGAGGSYK